MAGARRYCTTDRAAEKRRTRRQWVGVARPKPSDCVTKMPMTMANCVRTPKGNHGAQKRTRVRRRIPRLPLISGGAISERYMGPTQIPIPAATPTRNLESGYCQATCVFEIEDRNRTFLEPLGQLKGLSRK